MLPIYSLSGFNINPIKTYYNASDSYHFIGTNDRIRIIINQNCAKWKDLRTNQIGASMVGDAIGVSTYYNRENENGELENTPQGAYQKKKNPIPFSNRHTERGHEYEPVAAYCLEKVTGLKCYNGFIWKYKSPYHTIDPWNR